MMKFVIEYDFKTETSLASKLTADGTAYYVGATKICPVCKFAIIGHSAISRKDNTTQICSNCATIEALQAFQDYKNKQYTKTTKMKKITKDNLLKLVELKIKYIQTKDEKILEVINDYITNVINKDKHYYSKLKSYNFSDDILKYLL